MPADPRSFLPLRPVDLQLLLALASEERHGYGLVQEIADRTDGLVKLDPGNLYRVIKRLVDDGLVAETEHRAAPDLGNQRRRYYKLTAFGGRVLGAELERLRAMMGSADVRAAVRRFAT